MDACHISFRRRDDSGYPVVYFEGRSRRVHRISYALHNEIPISEIDNVVIRHKCDNRLCMNPEHLEPGTHADNVRDRVERGRGRYLKNEEHSQAKLTDAQVLEIKKLLSTRTNQYLIAAMFGVSQAHISNIKNGKYRK